MSHENNDDFNLCVVASERFSSDLNSPLCPMVGLCGHSITKIGIEYWFKARQTDEHHKQKLLLPCAYNCMRKWVIAKGPSKGEIREQTITSFRPKQLVPNHILCEALAVIENLEAASSASSGIEHTNGDAALRFLPKCPRCGGDFTVESPSSKGDGHNSKAPIVGSCGHTFCASCIYDEHHLALQNSGCNTVKNLECPACYKEKSFNVDFLYENISLVAALRHGQNLIERHIKKKDEGALYESGVGTSTSKQRENEALLSYDTKDSTKKAREGATGAGSVDGENGEGMDQEDIAAKKDEHFFQSALLAMKSRTWDRHHYLLCYGVALQAVSCAAKNPSIQIMLINQQGVPRSVILDWIAKSPKFGVAVRQIKAKLGTKKYESLLTASMSAAGYSFANSGGNVNWILPKSICKIDVVNESTEECRNNWEALSLSSLPPTYALADTTASDAADLIKHVDADAKFTPVIAKFSKMNCAPFDRAHNTKFDQDQDYYFSYRSIKKPSLTTMDQVLAKCQQEEWNEVLDLIRKNKWIAVTAMTTDKRSLKTSVLHKVLTSAGCATKAQVDFFRSVLLIAPEAARIRDGDKRTLRYHIQDHSNMDAQTKRILEGELDEAYKRSKSKRRRFSRRQQKSGTTSSTLTTPIVSYLNTLNT